MFFIATSIMFFSLDVEGAELPILKTIPFDKLNISVLAVEYVHGSNKQDYINFMKLKGYQVYKDIAFKKPEIHLYVNDFIFVKEGLLRRN